MTIIDRYFLGRFIKTLIFSLLVFIFIFIVVTLIEELESFIDQETGLRIVVKYYLYMLPNTLILVLPVSMLMAALFTTGQFVKKGELTAIKAAGISLYRLFLPVYIFAFFVSAFSFWFGDRYAYDSEKKKTEIWTYEVMRENIRLKQRREDISFQETGNRFIKIGEFIGYKSLGLRVIIEHKEGHRITTSMYADSIVYEEGNWVLRNITKRDFSPTETMTKLPELVIDDFNFIPEDLFNVDIDPRNMNLVELEQYMQKLQIMGNPFEEFIVTYHHKIAFPFVNLIVVLLGLPLATKKWGGGAAIGFGLCLFITFMYFMIMTFSEAFGIKGTLHPIAAAWFSNFLFGSLSLYLLVTAKK
ncbi:MAG: YjgP/YjgQ family permease [bacterium]|nr:YjgP/YjgQ family permease [bacterium]